ncbi:AMP-binding protein [Opitutus sp. GAS368]|uniref:AMP-binding protein n=1 Tax=Opitutus sp. GAS368 TaxID=1882749 RepID=UPI002101A11D|nr:AMP-binding protein [Opitutus sp. GAS368]
MTALAAAVAGDGEVFLGSPAWGANERAQLKEHLSLNGPSAVPQVCSAISAPSAPSGLSASVSQSENRGQTPGGQQPATARSQISQPAASGWLMIPTGGTSGRLKFARHDEETLAAAVGGFSRHFGLAQVNAAGVLPLHHVSGLMAWLRCALTGGEYRPLDWKAVEGGDLPVLPAKPAGWTISLVPTQLERLLNCRAGSPHPASGASLGHEARRDAEIPPYNQTAVEWLRQFRIIFLGGGPAWPALLDRAAAAGLPLSLGYGMTETAAMVTALRPEEFLAGARNCGTALPHATVRIGADNTIIIGGDSLFRGYHPAWRDRGDFETQDHGLIDERNRLFVLGRRDAVIITGGEKVEPAELEAVLRGTGQFPDLVVLGLPDARWGQLLVVVYPGNAHPNFHEVIRATNHLADYKRPKRYIPLVGAWPATGQGKVNRAGLVERVAAQLKERR